MSDSPRYGSPRHFLTLMDLDAAELRGVLARAAELKRLRREGRPHRSLPGRVLGMLFEKASTRTRVSFEAGIAHLGGTAIFLSPRDTHLGRGEPIEDTARIISSMVDAVVVRTFAHDRIELFAANSSVPVVNALTDAHHPCQLLADLQTYIEHRGDITGRQVAWVGDGNNMCNSFVEAAALLDFRLCVACPPGYEPAAAMLAPGGDRVRVYDDPVAAVAGADLVATDVWASMGREEEQARRAHDFGPFQVNAALMSHAPRAVVMHCLPAHRGEEITSDVLEGPQSVVWDEAENRLHAQKALLELLLDGSQRNG